MKIKEIIDYLESLAPVSSQENYDNSGLIVGDSSVECTETLISLDCIEETVDEAIEKGCNLIIAHHPIVFSGLKKLTGKNYIERTVIKAIKNDIAIYAIHTNFDNYLRGVNDEIGDRLGIVNRRILSPKKKSLLKLVCFVPQNEIEKVSKAMYSAGAGNIGGYSECSFSTVGTGTFKPGATANPSEGKVGELSVVQEVRFEVLVSEHRIHAVVRAMKENHSYEEVAHEIYPILNENQSEGAGMIGDLPQEMETKDFLRELKQKFNCGIIRHTKITSKSVKKIAFCGGSGSFLLGEAKKNKADLFITGDFKYHEFFDAENDIIIADIGHFESEQFTSHRIERILTKKFTNFAVRLTEVSTNPIKYF